MKIYNYEAAFYGFCKQLELKDVGAIFPALRPSQMKYYLDRDYLERCEDGSYRLTEYGSQLIRGVPNAF